MVKELACFANSIYAIYGMSRRLALCYMKMPGHFARLDGDVNVRACKSYAQDAWAARILSDRYKTLSMYLKKESVYGKQNPTGHS
ncbi:hypothetical protein AwEntero_27800 [Enterobacterales bacterium]|nr:hypothetical protein AwEntero_27800 [Enterobacterales bacterium]